MYICFRLLHPLQWPASLLNWGRTVALPATTGVAAAVTHHGTRAAVLAVLACIPLRVQKVIWMPRVMRAESDALARAAGAVTAASAAAAPGHAKSASVVATAVAAAEAEAAAIKHAVVPMRGVVERLGALPSHSLLDFTESLFS